MDPKEFPFTLRIFVIQSFVSDFLHALAELTDSDPESQKNLASNWFEILALDASESTTSFTIGLNPYTLGEKWERDFKKLVKCLAHYMSKAKVHTIRFHASVNAYAAIQKWLLFVTNEKHNRARNAAFFKHHSAEMKSGADGVQALLELDADIFKAALLGDYIESAQGYFKQLFDMCKENA